MADPRVVMTGAAGNVGTTLWRAWEEEDRYELTLTDRQPIEGARSRTGPRVGGVGDLAAQEGRTRAACYACRRQTGERPT